MKNSIGAVKKLKKTVVRMKKSTLSLENMVTKRSGSQAILAAITGRTNINNLSSFVLITLPSLFKNVFLSAQETGLRAIARVGIDAKELINISNPNIFVPLKIMTHSLSMIPRAVPAKNITFQKLSLLSRALIQFISIYAFVYNGILATLSKLLKKITNLSLVTLLLFSNIVVNGEDLKSLIGNVEKRYAIPQGLLYSIALVESRVNPYAINVEGEAIILRSEAAALKAIEYYRNLGHTNIDIGVMQINYRWHGKEFASLKEMLNVNSNIEYAAKLLTSLYKEHGSWHRATRLYHSATPEHHKKYSKKIITAWLKS